MGVRRLCWALLVLGCIASGARAQSADITTGSVPLEQRGLGFLKNLPREWSGTSDRDCKTYEDKNLDRLVTPFAASAAAFLDAFRQVHGEVTITSAHRTAEEQTCVCIGEKGPCAGRPRVKVIKVKKKKRRIVVRGISRHQLGIALDVRPGTGSEDEFICLHEFAQINPQFGVHFPLGRHDFPHMEPRASRASPMRLAALAAAKAPIVPCNRMRIMLTHDHVD